jgi:hypothetical protein
MLERFGSVRIKVCFLILLGIFEYLERSQIRFLIGYYIAVKASKKKTEN